MAIRRLVTLILLMVAWSQLIPTAAGQLVEGTDRLGQYLDRLGLEQLKIEHLEQQLANTTDLEQRSELAAKLIQYYAIRLLETQDGSQIDWASKSKKLLDSYPKLATPGIELSLHQAQFNQTEKEFQVWWREGRADIRRSKLQQSFRQMSVDLANLAQILDNEYNDRLSLMQVSKENRAGISALIMQTESRLLHASYLLGWTNYFIAILNEPERKERAKAANLHFREFLQVEPLSNIIDTPPKWFDFSSDWNSRAIIGLGMSERILGHDEQSDYCFDLIRDHGSLQSVRELSHTWRVNSRVYAGIVPDILVVPTIQQSTTISMKGKIAFWRELIHAGQSFTRVRPELAKQLKSAGALGLVRHFQFELLDSTLNPGLWNDEQEDQLDDFATALVKGYWFFESFNRTKQQTMATDARNLLESALLKGDRIKNQRDLDCCRYLIARLDLQEKQFARAAIAFADVAQRVVPYAPELAADSQWLCIVCWSALGNEDPSYIFKANEAIDKAIFDYPGTATATKARFERLKINARMMSPPQAIKLLEQIKPGDSNFADASFELAKLRYRDWLQTQSESTSDIASKKMMALLDAVDQAIELSHSPEQSLRTQLLAIDACFRSENNELFSRLNQARGVAETLTNRSMVTQEFHFFAFRYALRTNDSQGQNIELEWLNSNARGTSFQLAAMIQATQAADRQFRNIPSPNRAEVLQLTRQFKELLALLGSDDNNLVEQANARVSLVRLGQLEREAGNVDAAMAIFSRINRLFPNRKSYLKELAITLAHQNKYGEAEKIWRRLSHGVKAGDSLWFEAKVEICKLLIQQQKMNEARMLLSQTIKLGGEIPTKWDEQIESLKARIGPTDSSANK